MLLNVRNVSSKIFARIGSEFAKNGQSLTVLNLRNKSEKPDENLLIYHQAFLRNNHSIEVSRTETSCSTGKVTEVQR